jgi:hypothetical protein
MDRPGSRHGQGMNKYTRTFVLRHKLSWPSRFLNRSFGNIAAHPRSYSTSQYRLSITPASTPASDLLSHRAQFHPRVPKAFFCETVKQRSTASKDQLDIHITFWIALTSCSHLASVLSTSSNFHQASRLTCLKGSKPTCHNQRILGTVLLPLPKTRQASFQTSGQR